MAISQETLRDIRKFFAYAPIIMPALIGLAKDLQNISDLEEEANKASERLKQKLEEEKQIDDRIASLMNEANAKADDLVNMARNRVLDINAESDKRSAEANKTARDIV